MDKFSFSNKVADDFTNAVFKIAIFAAIGMISVAAAVIGCIVAVVWLLIK